MTNYYSEGITTRWGLQSLTSDEKKELFIKNTLLLIELMSRETDSDEYLYKFVSEEDKSPEWYLDSLLDATELQTTKFIGNTNYYNIFLSASKHYFEFLACLELLLQAYKEKPFPQLQPHIDSILKVFSILITDFTIDKTNYSIVAKLDPVTIHEINSNSRSITAQSDQNLQLYTECIDDLLDIKAISQRQSPGGRLSALKKLCGVLDRCITVTFDDKVRLSSPNLVAAIFSVDNTSTNIQIQKSIVTFIIQNIHHSKSGKANDFNELEFLYWWRQINTLIYIVTQSTSKENE